MYQVIPAKQAHENTKAALGESLNNACEYIGKKICYESKKGANYIKLTYTELGKEIPDNNYDIEILMNFVLEEFKNLGYLIEAVPDFEDEEHIERYFISW